MSVDLQDRKATGSYYTDFRVARFLTDWAVRTGTERVLEPSVGDGAFIEAVQARSAQLDAANGSAAVAVDLDPQAVRAAQARFGGVDVRHGDFFSFTPEQLGHFDVVVGNPPFIRYHSFTGTSRARALRQAQRYGVDFSASTSSWAPFLLHAAAHLRRGGRLAMVAPYEITYARYARPVVQKLAESFAALQLLTFDEPLFPEISEKTVLILADGYGGSTSYIRMSNLGSVNDLTLPLGAPQFTVPATGVISGGDRVSLFNLPAGVEGLYRAAATDERVFALGERADVTIGYVTGDNTFFHLSEMDVATRGIPASDLRWCIRKSADLNGIGLDLIDADKRSLSSKGAHWLFRPLSEDLHPKSAEYVSVGESLGTQNRYKCRVRTPWFVVPGVREPEMFVSVITSRAPRLVVNQAAAVATNSVLVVDRKDTAVEPRHMAMAALTSLAQLSAEIEGHALGGGALKLEPGEARRWLLPLAGTIGPDDEAAVDGLLRDGRFGAAHDAADEILLQRGLGWHRAEIALMREAIHDLRRRRSKTSSRRSADV